MQINRVSAVFGKKAQWNSSFCYDMLALEKLLYILIDSIEIMEKLGMTKKRLDGVFDLFKNVQKKYLNILANMF